MSSSFTLGYLIYKIYDILLILNRQNILSLKISKFFGQFNQIIFLILFTIEILQLGNISEIKYQLSSQLVPFLKVAFKNHMKISGYTGKKKKKVLQKQNP